MFRLVQADLAAAWQHDRGPDAPALLRDFGAFNFLGLERFYGSGQVIAHQVKLGVQQSVFACLSVGRMHRHFGWRQTENQPSAACVHGLQLQDIGKERSIRGWIFAVKKNVRAGQHARDRIMMLVPDRTRARELAAEYIAKGDPVGWFEHLYREGEEGKTIIPWADLQPSPNLLDFWRERAIPSAGQNALVIGCGLGDDAEQIAQWGFPATAFDVSETAIRACRRRFPESKVRYVAADLLEPPREWSRAFDFVFESNTLQVLPPEPRVRAIENAASFVRDGGDLLVIARARNATDPPGEMPWPLTRAELDHFTDCGLHEISLEDFFDRENPPARRFRALYHR